MANKETCQLFIIFPEHEDVDKTSPCIREFTLLAPDEVMTYIDFIDRMEQRERAEHYLLYYDSNNIRNFLYPVYQLEEYYPNVELTLLNSLQRFAEDWREEPIQECIVNYKLFQAPVTDDSFCEICERKYQSDIEASNSTYAIINHSALEEVSTATMHRNMEQVDIPVLEATIENIESWLQVNRRPTRVYNWNRKHGVNGIGAYKEHKNDPVAILYCSISHATELLHKAMGEDNEIGPLYAWDEEYNRYMEFKRESKSSTTFHSYHLEDGDRKISSIRKLLGK